MAFHSFTRKTGVIALILLMLCVSALSTLLPGRKAYAASVVTINGSTQYQSMDGFGFSEAFGEAQALENLSSSSQRQQILDLLFNPKTGAGMTILRNLFPSDPSNTIEPNSPGSPTATPTYVPLGSSEGQVWLAKVAQSYGVRQFYGDAWSAPGFMKTNGSEINGGALCGVPGTSCSTGDWRQAYANYLLQYYKDYLREGIPLTEISGFNEPNWTAPYSSMVMNATQTADFVAVLGPTLQKAGAHAQIVCCDPVNWWAAQYYADGITSNPTANAYTSIISSHGYGRGPDSALTGIGNKHIWETEWGDLSGNNTWDPAWDDGSAASGFTWAQNIYTGITAANLSAFFWWWGVDAAYNVTDNGILIQASNGVVNVSKRLWALANYSRFIRPGAVRIGASSDDSNLQVTSYKNIDGTVSVVILNTSNSDLPLALSLQDTGIARIATAVPYVTNASNNTAQQPALFTTNGTFSSTIPARTLITYQISSGH
ncbi:MAG TPA: glycoside hydrolase [Ktedonobacteraceae bacterium]